MNIQLSCTALAPPPLKAGGAKISPLNAKNSLPKNAYVMPKDKKLANAPPPPASSKSQVTKGTAAGAAGAGAGAGASSSSSSSSKSGNNCSKPHSNDSNRSFPLFSSSSSSSSKLIAIDGASVAIEIN